MNSLRNILTKSSLPVQKILRNSSKFSDLQLSGRTLSTTATGTGQSEVPNDAGKVRYGLENKVAIVTASTDGIGLAIAKKLAQNGASVVISSRKQDNVDKALKELHDQGLTSVVGQVCHVANADHRKELIDCALKKFGGIDILVSNAATNPAVGGVLDADEQAFDKIFEVNVKSAFMLTKEIAPHIEMRNGGSIVYIASIAAYQPMGLLALYSVSKTALLGLTKATAEQCASSNIRVNCVCPGVIKTRFSSALWKNEAFTEEFERMVMIKRIGQPEEVSGMVAFLVSEDASYITGESFPVAGGYFSRL